MRLLRCIAIATIALATHIAIASAESHLPAKNLERYIFTNLDLATFPSSLHQRLGTFHHFTDVQVHVSSISPGKLLLTDFWTGWIYDFEILGRGDFNGDGIEDVKVCFIDNGHPAGGSYYAVEPLLLTQLSANGSLIATAYKSVDMRCEKKPK